MASQCNRESLRAVAIVVVAAAVLVSLRLVYQGHRRASDMKEARAVVQQQLDAFKTGDFEKAFSFAASAFHETMSLAQFRKMVEEGYSQIAHPREIRVGDGRWDRRIALVDVGVTGEDGLVLPCTYTLERERRGWRVTAVVLNHAPVAPGSQP